MQFLTSILPVQKQLGKRGYKAKASAQIERTMNSELALFEYLGSAGIGARIAADPSLNARIGNALGWV